MLHRANCGARPGEVPPPPGHFRLRSPPAGHRLLAGLPGTAAWALGVLVGVNMIFGGTAMIAMALHARRGG